MVFVVLSVHPLALAHDCFHRRVFTTRMHRIVPMSHRLTASLCLGLHPHEPKLQHAFSEAVVCCYSVSVDSQTATD